MGPFEDTNSTRQAGLELWNSGVKERAKAAEEALQSMRKPSPEQVLANEAAARQQSQQSY